MTGIPNALRPNPSPMRPMRPQTIQFPMTTYHTTSTTEAPQLIFTEPTPLVQNQLVNTNSQCGVPEFKAPTTTGLVLGGFQAIRGQFPW
jgi:hypothetical protein